MLQSGNTTGCFVVRRLSLLAPCGSALCFSNCRASLMTHVLLAWDREAAPTCATQTKSISMVRLPVCPSAVLFGSLQHLYGSQLIASLFGIIEVLHVALGTGRHIYILFNL